MNKLRVKCLKCSKGGKKIAPVVGAPGLSRHHYAIHALEE